MSNYQIITECRCCGSSNLVELLDLGDLAFSGIFLGSGEVVPEGRLKLIGCDYNIQGNCGLVQLDRDFEQSFMYGENYGYRSGLNSDMICHLQENVIGILKKGRAKAGDVILDIGSNDGTTLSFYPDKFQKIGIDPTISKFQQYYPKNVITLADFFSKTNFVKIFGAKKAKIVTSFSMFYDLPKPLEFAQDVADILDPVDGIWVLEQSDLHLMLKTNSVDTICHEHSEYYSFTTLNYIFERASLKVIDIEFNETNGGSSLITVAHKTAQFEVNNQSISEALAREAALMSDPIKTFKNFETKFNKQIQLLQQYLQNCHNQNKKVAALGASTKGNIILQYASLTPTQIPFIGEVNEDKYGKFSPGSSIPIVSEDWLIDQGYSEFVVLPWHFKSFFLKMKKLNGSKLIFVLPEYEEINV